MNLAGPFKARTDLGDEKSVPSATVDFRRRYRDVLIPAYPTPALKGRYAANFVTLGVRQVGCNVKNRHGISTENTEFEQIFPCSL